MPPEKKFKGGILYLLEAFDHQAFFAISFGDFALQGDDSVFHKEVFCCVEKFREDDSLDGSGEIREFDESHTGIIFGGDNSNVIYNGSDGDWSIYFNFCLDFFNQSSEFFNFITICIKWVAGNV